MAAAEVFEPVCRRAAAPNLPATEALIAAAKSLHARGLTPSYGPGDHGNLSCRTPDGCLITGRETPKDALRSEDLAHVVGREQLADRARLVYDGCRRPSTDALMHLEIYARRPDIGAIIHGHDGRALANAERLGLPITRTSARTNSLELIEETAALCARHDYVILRDHGFLALGATLDAADQLLQRWYQRASQGGF